MHGVEAAYEEDAPRWLIGDAVDSRETVPSEEVDEVALSSYGMPGSMRDGAMHGVEG